MSILPHPFTVAGRTFCTAAFQAGETLGRYIERNHLNLPRCVFNVYHNGQFVSRNLWDRLIPRVGDQVVIRGVGQGGDAGKVVRNVAMLALTLSAPYMAGYALTGSWAVTTGFAASALTAGIIVGGALIVSPLLPEIKA
jgi:hypothetical protein